MLTHTHMQNLGRSAGCGTLPGASQQGPEWSGHQTYTPSGASRGDKCPAGGLSQALMALKGKSPKGSSSLSPARSPHTHTRGESHFTSYWQSTHPRSRAAGAPPRRRSCRRAWRTCSRGRPAASVFARGGRVCVVSHWCGECTSSGGVQGAGEAGCSQPNPVCMHIAGLPAGNPLRHA